MEAFCVKVETIWAIRIDFRPSLPNLFPAIDFFLLEKGFSFQLEGLFQSMESVVNMLLNIA